MSTFKHLITQTRTLSNNFLLRLSFPAFFPFFPPSSPVRLRLVSTHGHIGPVLALTVPPVRKSMGWKPAERIPTTFPREYRSILRLLFLFSAFRLLNLSHVPQSH